MEKTNVGLVDRTGNNAFVEDLTVHCCHFESIKENVVVKSYQYVTLKCHYDLTYNSH